jgi:rhodanese-related sulfurtransferase
MDRTLAAERLRRWLQTGDSCQLLDVRRRVDFDADQAMLPRALWREPESVTEWYRDLQKTTPVVVYCVHGRAVGQGVADYLRAQGFEACYLEGGIEAWKAIGAPVVQKQSTT